MQLSVTKLLLYSLFSYLVGCSNGNTNKPVGYTEQQGNQSNTTHETTISDQPPKEENQTGESPKTDESGNASQIQPDTNTNKPAPELNQEERERMIRGTEIEEKK